MMLIRRRLLALQKWTYHSFYLTFILLTFSLHSISVNAQSIERCRVQGYAFEVECGQIKTFIKSDKQHSLVTHLAFYKVPARVRYPDMIPIFWIPDSFGNATAERAGAVVNALSRLRNNRDFIWMDMRGTGKSYPLNCNRTSTRLTDRLYRYSDMEFNRQCLLQIARHGGLSAFSKQAIAQDYELLRKEIGAPAVYVVAEGRGVDVAQAWAKMHPNAIKRMVLDSPQTDNVSEYAQQTADVMQLLDQQCGKTEPCQQLSIAANFKKIHDSLPLTIAAIDPITHQKTSLLLTKEAFTYAVINVLRTPKRSRHLAYVLSVASHHDWQPLIGLIAYAWTKRDVDFNVGLGMANQCNMYVQPFKKVAQLSGIASRIYDSEHRRLASLCKPLTQLTAVAVNEDTQISTPALVLTGEASPMVKRSLPSLVNQINIRVPGAGQHILMYGCAKDIVYRYFKLQDTKANKPIMKKQLDASCLENIPYPSAGYTEFYGAKRD